MREWAIEDCDDIMEDVPHIVCLLFCCFLLSGI